MSETESKIVVLEGPDASGSTTQWEMLGEYLNQRKIGHLMLKFPTHEETFWGRHVDRFLNNEFGPAHQVNPYLAVLPYALDRAEMMRSSRVMDAQERGLLIVMDRYQTAPMGHQAGVFEDQGERRKFQDWDEQMEFGEFKIPQPDLVILISIPIEVSQENMRRRGRKGYIVAEDNLDGLERDEAYLRRVAETFLEVAAREENWVVVQGSREDGTMRPKEEIHQEIIGILKQREFL